MQKLWTLFHILRFEFELTSFQFDSCRTPWLAMSTHQAELEKELFHSCIAGDIDTVHKVIAAGVDPNKTISKGILTTRETPLLTACRYVSHCTSIIIMPLVRMWLLSREACLQLLLHVKVFSNKLLLRAISRSGVNMNSKSYKMPYWNSH